jgi:hypothetical protein
MQTPGPGPASSASSTTFATVGSPPPPSPVSCSDGSFISSKVFELASRFDRVGYGNCRASGSCRFSPPQPQSQPSAAYGPLIQAAFDSATPASLEKPGNTFRDRLCRLDKIYVDPFDNDHVAWGMRELRRGNIRHIGISKKLLDDIASSTTTYAKYETEILRRLLGPTPSNPNGAAWLQQASYTSVTPESPAIAVLAILSHEMAHATWWHRGVPNLTCSGISFPRIAWDRISILRGFHKFDAEHGSRSVESFDKTDMVDLLDQGLIDDVSADMKTIYRASQRWVGLFSFVAPDEDFIETYKYWVLQNAGVTSIKIQFPTSGLSSPVEIDVMDKFKNASATSDLGKKVAWIKQWLQDQCSGPAP